MASRLAADKPITVTYNNSRKVTTMSNNLQPMRPHRRGIDIRTLLGVLAGLYTISPIDAVPDVIPVAGQADDIMVILATLLIILLITLINPRNRGDHNVY